jgi:hypothetical protein
MVIVSEAWKAAFRVRAAPSLKRESSQTSYRQGGTLDVRVAVLISPASREGDCVGGSLRRSAGGPSRAIFIDGQLMETCQSLAHLNVIYLGLLTLFPAPQ